MAIQTKNPFGDGAGGDGPGANGGNDFTKRPQGSGGASGGNNFVQDPSGGRGGAPPGGNDFTKNPGGFNGAKPSATPVGPDMSNIPAGGRQVFPTPGGGGMKPSPMFKLKP
jgi:hypothetical protein